MAFAQISKVRLEYFPHGHGPDRVVFIHGFQASARIWRMTQEALPAHRYTSIAINNRGAGASDAPADERDYSVEIFANDAFELVEQLGWSDFTLVGHSLGGATAAQFAVDHPGSLKGLVLLDPADPDGRALPAGTDLDALIDRQMAGLRSSAGGGSSDDQVAGVGASGVDVPADLLRALATDIRAAPEQRLRGSLRSMLTIRSGDRVKDLTMPVLLAGGDADALIPAKVMLATWAKLPPGSGLHFWHGIGHSPNLDCPADLAALLQRFIEVTMPARRTPAQAATIA